MEDQIKRETYWGDTEKIWNTKLGKQWLRKYHAFHRGFAHKLLAIWLLKSLKTTCSLAVCFPDFSRQDLIPDLFTNEPLMLPGQLDEYLPLRAYKSDKK